MEQVRLGIIGIGNMGTAHANNIKDGKCPEIKLTAVADIKMGEASATAWGCDLTYDYVKINADYRS